MLEFFWSKIIEIFEIILVLKNPSKFYQKSSKILQTFNSRLIQIPTWFFLPKKSSKLSKINQSWISWKCPQVIVKSLLIIFFLCQINFKFISCDDRWIPDAINNLLCIFLWYVCQLGYRNFCVFFNDFNMSSKNWEILQLLRHIFAPFSM